MTGKMGGDSWRNPPASPASRRGATGPRRGTGCHPGECRPVQPRRSHAVRRGGRPGWVLEAMTKPTWADVGWLHLQGLDRQLVPGGAPSNRWGKTRELQATRCARFHRQAADLLHVTLGGALPVPAASVSDMSAVGETCKAVQRGAPRRPDPRRGGGYASAPGHRGPARTCKSPLEIAQTMTASRPSWAGARSTPSRRQEYLKTVPLRPRSASISYNARVADAQGDQAQGAAVHGLPARQGRALSDLARRGLARRPSSRGAAYRGGRRCPSRPTTGRPRHHTHTHTRARASRMPWWSLWNVGSAVEFGRRGVCTWGA